jgi:CheY-like chemotaxis protein
MACALEQSAGVMGVSCGITPRILIADDQPDLIDALRLLLKGEGIEYDAVASPEAALDALHARAFDLVLMDLNYTGDTTSGREGIDLLARVQAFDRLLPVIVMTGWGSVDLAVEAMRRGVRDFVQRSTSGARAVAKRPRNAASCPKRFAFSGVCCRSRFRRSTAGSLRSRGSRRRASAAIVSTRYVSAIRAWG